MAPIYYGQRTEFLRLSLAEWLVLGSTVFCVGVYEFLGLQFVSPWSLFLQRVISLGLFYLYALIPFFLVIRFIHLRQQRVHQHVPSLMQTWRYFRTTQLNAAVFTQHARYLLLLSWLFVLFIQLKNLAPFIVRKVFDSFVDKFERGAFKGELLSQTVRDYFGPNYADIFSEGYFLFYPFVSLLIYIFLFQPNPRLRAEFLFAFTLTWIIGALLVLVIPTLGPCFSSEINILPHELPVTGVAKMQLEIWNLRSKLLATGSGINLISGFPSLHVAVVTLGALYLRRISITLSMLVWIFCCLTIITTLYFGWHYVVDDIGGVLLALFAFRYARFKYAQYIVAH